MSNASKLMYQKLVESCEKRIQKIKDFQDNVVCRNDANQIKAQQLYKEFRGHLTRKEAMEITIEIFSHYVDTGEAPLEIVTEIIGNIIKRFEIELEKYRKEI